MSATLEEAIAFYARAVRAAIIAQTDDGMTRYLLRLGSRWIDALEAIRVVEIHATSGRQPKNVSILFTADERPRINELEEAMIQHDLTDEARIEWLDAYPDAISVVFEARTAARLAKAMSSKHAGLSTTRARRRSLCTVRVPSRTR